MKTIPLFPGTRPLALKDKPLLDRLFKSCPPVISEFTFTNLFAWRRAYHFSLARLDDAVLVVSEKEDGLQIFDPLARPDKKARAIEQCFQKAGPAARVIFRRVPEATAALVKGRGLRIEEDRDNFDYLYKTKDMMELSGKKFDAKRNFIKRFKDAQEFGYERCTKANIRQCLDFQEEWCLAKDCQHTEGLLREKEAMREMLAHFDELKITGGMIVIGGKVEAVTLGEELNPETFVIHVEKANGKFIGIYQALQQLFAADAARHCLYINREQDLGVPGLRQAKESYHPCAMVKKYTLS
ncbi:MAG: phosphatidylglycerol lysyltransferase domain-containing protein [Candidatus Omnitrophota bacterium]